MVMVVWLGAHTLVAGESASSATNKAAALYLQNDLLAAPFSAHRGSFFYSTLGIPMMETADTLPPNTVYLRVRTGCSASARGPTMANDEERRQYIQETVHNGDTPTDIFSGWYATWLAMEASFGVLPWLEIGGRVAYAGWTEHEDTFYLFDAKGTPLVRWEGLDIYNRGASGRQDDLSDVVLKAKARVLRSGDSDVHNTLSLGASVKLPAGSPRDLEDAGTTDLALSILDTLDMGSLSLHASVSDIIPTGRQNLFIPEDDIALHSFVAGSVGLTWRTSDTLALGLQAEGNTSAFADVPFLDGNVLTVTAGARKLIGCYVLEAGAGKGCTAVSYDWSGYLAIGRCL